MTRRGQSVGPGAMVMTGQDAIGETCMDLLEVEKWRTYVDVTLYA